MAETEQTKVCPLCAETIKAAAKVCPYCRKSQRRWVFMTRYDVIGLITVLAFAGVALLSIKMFLHGRDFGPDRDKIRVLDYHFGISKEQHETNIIVCGVLTNESEHSWNIGNFDIRYWDKNGKILGVDNPSDGSTVLPHGEEAFRMTLYSREFIPQFARCKVTVISATDPRFPD